jgi:diguanylate cyclase (GGDEF)-like protein
MEVESCFRGLVIDAPVYLSAVTMLGMIVLALWIIRNEDFFGRRHFLATVIGMILWLAAATFELATPSLECKVIAASVTWPAIALVPVSWCLFMWHFCFSVPTHGHRAESAAVVLIVAAVSLAALTNPVHGLFYTEGTALVSIAGRPFVYFDHGPLFYVVAGVLYLFLVAGLGVAGTAAFQASRSLRPLMLMLMFATAVPVLSNFAYVVLGASLFGFDPTPFAFSFVLLSLTWAIFGNRGLDLVTLARDLLYFNLVDPVLVVNSKGLVVGANAAAREIMPRFDRVAPLDEGEPFDLIRTVIGCRRSAAGQSEVSFAGRSFNMRVLPIPRPLREDGEHLGAVAIMSDVTQLKIKNEQLELALARSRDQVAEITRLREIAEQSALSDPLTGIGNRRSLEARVKALGDMPLALSLIDLDHFKQINDTLGHAVGDRVLRDFADTARAILPPHADVFRVGGEEFVILVAGKPLADLLSLLGALRQQMVESRSVRDDDVARVTFSAGVAVRPGDGDTFDQLYARADMRLYQAKRNGRDRVMHLDCVSLNPGHVKGNLGKTGGRGA